MIDSDVSSIYHAIQLSVAPVFLLTGIAGLLGVMTSRLARAVDHIRELDRHWKSTDEAPTSEDLLELTLFRRRALLANNAIAACTAGGFLVCLVIATLFIDAFLGTHLRWFAGIAYFLSTIALILGLALFQGEIYFAAHTLSKQPTKSSFLGRARGQEAQEEL